MVNSLGKWWGTKPIVLTRSVILKSLFEASDDADRAVKHLVDCTNFWSERQSKHLVILAYLYQTTGTHEAWNDLRPQLLRLAVENHRA